MFPNEVAKGKRSDNKSKKQYGFGKRSRSEHIRNMFKRREDLHDYCISCKTKFIREKILFKTK